MTVGKPVNGGGFCRKHQQQHRCLMCVHGDRPGTPVDHYREGFINGAQHAAADSRARAIRAVVAAQWGYAVCLAMSRAADERVAAFDSLFPASAETQSYRAGLEDSSHSFEQWLSNLPCAVDIVDGVA